MTEPARVQAFETVNLHRRGGAATIELNRPDTAERVEQAVRPRPARRDRGGGRRRRGPGRRDPRRRTGLLLRRRPQGHGRRRRSRPHARGPARRPQRPDRALPPDHHRHPSHAQAGGRRGPRAGGRHRVLAGAGLRPHRRRPESAYFLLAFVNIGLVPDGGSSLLVPARAGFTRARWRWRCSGERIGAAQALEWGLINRVFPDGGFDDEVDALMDRLAAGPTALLRGNQAPAQPLALRAHGRAARARGRRSSRRWPGPPTSSRASPRSSRSAPDLPRSLMRHGSRPPAGAPGTPPRVVRSATLWSIPASCG